MKSHSCGQTVRVRLENLIIEFPGINSNIWNHVTVCKQKNHYCKIEMLKLFNCMLKKGDLKIIDKIYISFRLVGFYGISTIVGYLMPNPFIHIC